MSEISQKQIEANQKNAKLGGVKTEEGKAVSKYNALKHGGSFSKNIGKYRILSVFELKRKSPLFIKRNYV